MKTKLFIAMAIIAASFTYLRAAAAKEPSNKGAALRSVYKSATPHDGLVSAYLDPDPKLIKTYVVLERGGVPAEQARFFVNWQEYDYRGVEIHLDESERITTRRGAPYAYLQRGDVMAVGELRYFNRTFYLKLISSDKYVPENRKSDARFSRVTVMLGFKLPRDVIASDDAQRALSLIEARLRPFGDPESAKTYAASITGIVEDAESASQTHANDPDAKRLEALERKIEDARKQMEEADRELKRIKGKKRFD